MEQVITSALFFDGHSARSAPVRVLLFNGRVHLHDPFDDRFIQSFPLAGASHNQIGNRHFLYLDAKGMMYLELEDTHPLAASLAPELAKANPGWAQKLLSQKLWVLVALMLALSTALYLLLIGLVPLIGLNIISTKHEVEIGNRLHQVMLKEIGLTRGGKDTTGTYQLQAFADRLQLSKEYPIRVTLVHSQIVNAYALPGGQVVVFEGLLKKIKTPEALAALLAHESSHVNKRHSLRSLLRSSANGMIVSIVFGDVSGLSGALVSNVENLNGLRYSRTLEREADEQGMKLLLANGIPAKGMLQLMQTLEQQGDIPEALAILSSHPLTSQRKDAARDYIKNHPQQVSARTDLKTLFDALQHITAAK